MTSFATLLKANDSVICPVRLTTEYYKQLGLRMGDAAGDERHLCCRIRKSKGVWKAATGAPASLSKAREELKALLQQTYLTLPTLILRGPFGPQEGYQSFS